MTDARDSGGSGTGGSGTGGDGRGRGGGRDEVDGIAEADDETVVIVSDKYTRDAIGRLADGLRDAADLCDGFREGGETASRGEQIAILGELRERLTEIRLHAEGAARGVARLEREQLAKASAERHTTEGST